MLIISSNNLTEFQIPVQLCEWVIQHSFYRQFQLYLILKAHCSGKAKISNYDIVNIANEMGVCTKTVQSNLKKLIGENWIGYNPKSKYYFIRGFWKVMAQYGFTARSCSSLDVRELRNTKAHVIATYLKWLGNSQKKGNKVVRKFGIRTKQTEVVNNSFEVSNIGLSKCLGMSKAQAGKLKKYAKKSKLVKIERHYMQVPGITPFGLGIFKRDNPLIADLVKVVAGKVVVQRPDLLTCDLKLKSKRNFCKKVRK